MPRPSPGPDRAHRPARARLAAAGAALVTLVAPVAAGCGDDEAGATDRRLRVVATTPQVADILYNVGGTDINIITLVPLGADPHTYRPTEEDAREIDDANVVFASGGGLDEWARRIAQDRGVADADVIELAASVTQRVRNGRLDPHWWLDPRNIEAAATDVRDELIKRARAARLRFSSNLNDYVDQLQALELRSATCLAPIRRARRRFAADHEAFGYFAGRFRLTDIGGLTPATDRPRVATPAVTARLAARMRALGVPIVLAQDRSPAPARALARLAGARVVRGVSGDRLGGPGVDGDTLLAALTADTRSIAGALGAPPCPRAEP